MSNSPSLWRRLAAVFYDFLLLLGILFFATALILPFNAGQAVTKNLFYSIYLLLISFIFYGWFWTHGGQTLGLRAWKLQVLTIDKQPISWKQALLRFVSAILSWSVLGVGFFWLLLNKERYCWHDLLSKTTVFVKN